MIVQNESPTGPIISLLYFTFAHIGKRKKRKGKGRAAILLHIDYLFGWSVSSGLVLTFH